MQTEAPDLALEQAPGDVRGRSDAPSATAVLPRVVAGGAALLAGWIAAGSVGLLAHPLRHALTGLACGAVLLFERPRLGGSLHRWAIALGGVVAVAVATASFQVPVNVAGVAVWLGALALLHEGATRRVFALVATAVVGLAVFRLASAAVPVVWQTVDAVASGFGSLGGWVAGRSLSVGPTFGGNDFLAVMGVLWAGWLLAMPAPRWRYALAAGGAILGGHLLYLVILAHAADLRNGLPEARPPAQRFSVADQDKPSSKERWIQVARLGIPWNVPLVGAVIQMVIAAAMLRRIGTAGETLSGALGRVSAPLTPALSPSAGAREDPSGAPHATKPPVQTAVWAPVRKTAVIGPACAAMLALLLPTVSTFWPGRLSLEGKKIVVNEKGFLNWMKPEHGQYGSRSGGMYGLMATHLALYGAKTVISPDLAAKELADADVLMLIFPNEPWQPGQLERIWEFVERGGSLLVLGEHTTKDDDGSNRFNDVLKPTAMQVAFDSATFAVGGWLHSYAPQAHPSTLGITDAANSFGVVIGASVEADWPAYPILMGKWGWNDPGDEGERGTRAMLGNNRYDPGERLGDVVLAAEQRLGKGRMIVFGDTSGFTNGIASHCHEFLSRLFAYLGTKHPMPQPVWRQALGLLLAGALVASLVWQQRALTLTMAGLAFALSLTWCTDASIRAGRLIPDGGRQAPNNLAYIDSTHLGLFSDEGWRDDAVGGLRLTLNRNGYAAFSLPEFTRDRLLAAGLLVSIAPSRDFTKSERQIVREFVEQGGIFLITVGYEERRASRQLLADFGFEVGRVISTNKSVTAEPQPMGHFKVPYVDTGEYKSYVRYWASWPVTCTATNAQVIAYGHNDAPVIVQRQVGKGKVVVIGDTCFAMNKNLEREDGQPIEGMRENAHFWRWFLALLRDQPTWVPPKEAAMAQPAAGMRRPMIPAQQPRPAAPPKPIEQVKP